MKLLLTYRTFEELEREHDYLFNEKPTFFCPFCKKTELSAINVDEIKCQKCQIQFKCLGTPDQFHELIERRIVQHELVCDENIEFFTEPMSQDLNFHGLNAICMKCDYYSKLY